MRCPLCGEQDTKVVDSRLANEGDQVRRRRECKACQARFTTFETVERLLPRIVKADGRREQFSESKLRLSMTRALHKRPVSMDLVDAAINRIIRQLASSTEREIPTRLIGEHMMQELRGLDAVAFVRFASIYRSFEDINAFKEEIDRLEQHPPVGREQLSLLPDEKKKAQSK
ncbi:MAG: transcriptional regulator NrdR [Gammaproteobacteria bacterium]